MVSRRRKTRFEPGLLSGVAAIAITYLFARAGLKAILPSFWRWVPNTDYGPVLISETVAFFWAFFAGAFVVIWATAPGAKNDPLRGKKLTSWLRWALSFTVSVPLLIPVSWLFFNRDENPGGWIVLIWWTMIWAFAKGLRFAGLR